MSENMAPAERLLTFLDLLQDDTDEYIQNHEALLDAYDVLLKENDALKDTIATLMGEKHGD